MAFDRIFNSLNELKIELADNVNWFNKKRIHGALDYLWIMVKHFV
ncbi:IS3 family transposase [Anaerotignum propionicum]